MQAIEVSALRKSYRTRIKEPGLSAAFRALVKPVYKHVEAVGGVSFRVERGEILAFIGPNGAGKSTTIKMLTGILTPTGGDMRVLGMDPTRDRRKLSYHIGTVFGQKSQLWFHLPPSDSFELLGALYDVEKQQLKRRVAELADRFELGELMNTPVRKMSLGQRIRCEVAASLLHLPDILFLDEPTIGLDVVVKREIRRLILEMNREHGITVFLTSHDAGDVEQLCRRAIVIDRGSIVLDQPVETLRRDVLSRKVIAVRFTQAREYAPPAGVAIESKPGEQDALKPRFIVDTTLVRIEDAMRWVVAQGTVEDITVEDPPMEEIIATIFQRKAVQPL